MLDLLVRNGLAVTPHGSGYWDIGISKDSIVTIAPTGTPPQEAAQTIDATGKIVIPGGIDPHVHMKWRIPAPGGATHTLTADVEQVSRAAVHGGTTMLIDFATWDPSQTLPQALEQRDNDFRGLSYCDYAYHLLVLGGHSPEHFAEIPDAIRGGYASLKLFTTNVRPGAQRPTASTLMVSFGEMYEILQHVAKAGGIAAVHAEDDDIVMHNYKRLTREGRRHFTNMAEVHSTLSEDLAFRRTIRLAEHIEGAAVYFMHVSAKAGVEAIAEARAKGYPIYGESLHQYLLFSADAYSRPHGQIYHTYPSLKFNEDRRALWNGMANGTISTVATDELCTLLEVKLRGDAIDDTAGGNSGIEPRMGVMFTEAVANRGFSLEQFVKITSSNAARIFGLYPKKGALAVGSDADICIIDPNAKFVLDNARLHETDYSPWEGWKIAGWPTTTVVRGKVVVDDGKLVGKRGHGTWVPRQLSESIFFAPV